MTRIAVLDDWQGIARESADWSALSARAEMVFFEKPAGSIAEAAETLKDFDIILAMRERQPFPRALVEQLPKLRMVALTGRRAKSMDMAALAERGVPVCSAGGDDNGACTSELTIVLLLAAFRDLPAGDRAVRAGRFQANVRLGAMLEGRTLGILGLGRIGRRVARVAQAMDMRVIAWSQNLTEAAARDAGAELVSKDELFAAADAVTLHMVLSERSAGIVGAAELARMKPGAVVVNTSRGPLIDEAALLAALQKGRIRAALDVYWAEPLPAGHPLLSAPNTVLTPHLGYCVEELMGQFYRESIENILAFLDGAPIRVVNMPA
jgi:phosphoglycerate dehydrogenase-like enzyme